MKKQKSLFDLPCDRPECVCAQRCQYWDVKLAEYCKTPATPEQLEWAEVDLFLTLNCIVAHCPNRRARRKATIELLHPVFNRQRKECKVM
jgi:hypothetical protein